VLRYKYILYFILVFYACWRKFYILLILLIENIRIRVHINIIIWRSGEWTLSINKFLFQHYYFLLIFIFKRPLSLKRTLKRRVLLLLIWAITPPIKHLLHCFIFHFISVYLKLQIYLIFIIWINILFQFF
jgi:hypothetical protein